jgi:hypothetical protein
MSLSIWALHWLDAHMLSIWQPSTVLDAMIAMRDTETEKKLKRILKKLPRYLQDFGDL